MGDNYMKVYNKFYKTKEYIQFKLSNKSTVYEFLRTSIIRDSEQVRYGEYGGNYIYKNYFLNNKLVSRYSQKLIGDYFGMSRPAISKHIKDLEASGFIKIHKRTVKDGTAYYYELGTYDGKFETDNYKESYYLDTYFSKIYLDEKIQRYEDKYGKYEEVKLNENKSITAAEEHRETIIKFNTADEFVIFAMNKLGRIFDTKEITQHKKLWKEVQNMSAKS